MQNFDKWSCPQALAITCIRWIASTLLRDMLHLADGFADVLQSRVPM